jgi:hypothetical protein
MGTDNLVTLCIVVGPGRDKSLTGVTKHEILKRSYNKTNEMHDFLKFTFGIELYVFRSGFLSIIRNLVLYTQQ